MDITFSPALVITLLILAFNNFGDAVRDIMDPEVARSAGTVQGCINF